MYNNHIRHKPNHSFTCLKECNDFRALSQIESQGGDKKMQINHFHLNGGNQKQP